LETLSVLFVCHFSPANLDRDLSDLSLGGIEACNLELARALARRGYRVTLANEANEGSPTEHFGVAHIGIHQAAEQVFDAAVVSNIATAFDCLAKRQTTKIYWGHNPLRPEKALRRGYLGPILRHRPRAVFPSQYLASRMRHYPFRSRDILGHGIDKVFLESAAARHDSAAPARFVYASQPQRGLDFVLNLWRTAIAPALPQAELHVLGAATQPAEAGPRVHFHGRLSKRDMATFYQGARALLYPGAKDETFCLVAVEAHCVGVPIVTLGIGALKERVAQGVDGFICRDSADFVEKAILLGERSDLAVALGAGAQRQRVNRSWDFVATLWDSIIFRPSSAARSRGS
jgi:glycosyltransferase involved in cell wall biosynthesis